MTDFVTKAFRSVSDKYDQVVHNRHYIETPSVDSDSKDSQEPKSIKHVLGVFGALATVMVGGAVNAAIRSLEEDKKPAGKKPAGAVAVKSDLSPLIDALKSVCVVKAIDAKLGSGLKKVEVLTETKAETVVVKAESEKITVNITPAEPAEPVKVSVEEKRESDIADVKSFLFSDFGHRKLNNINEFINTHEIHDLIATVVVDGLASKKKSRYANKIIEENTDTDGNVDTGHAIAYIIANRLIETIKTSVDDADFTAMKQHTRKLSKFLSDKYSEVNSQPRSDVIMNCVLFCNIGTEEGK